MKADNWPRRGSALPLNGIRVTDLTRNVAGPYASMILAELGADVVKIERPGKGDDTRSWGPPFWQGESPLFLALNRNKRSLALDLEAPEAHEVLGRLVARSDVLLESFRPGALRRLGFDYGWAREINPRIIYCSITPFGEIGPMRDRPGYDPMIQAFAGLMSVTGHAGQPPVRVGVSVIDMGTGMWSALGILAALLRRDENSDGQHVVVSLYETGLAWMSYHLAAYWASGESPTKHGSGMFAIVPYSAFATQDGHLIVSAPNDDLWIKLCDVLGLSELATDDRYRTNPMRVRNRTTLEPLLRDAIARWRSAELSNALDRAGVPNSRLQSVDEVASDPQALALGMFQTTAESQVETLRSVALPLTMDGDRPSLRKAPPAVGEHTQEILDELGFDAAEIHTISDSTSNRSAQRAGRPRTED